MEAIWAESKCSTNTDWVIECLVPGFVILGHPVVQEPGPTEASAVSLRGHAMWPSLLPLSPRSPLVHE